MKRPSPSMVVALAALVVAMTGSAMAGSLITGGQIKNGSITGYDIKPGSITGAQIKDKSLRPKDLAKPLTGGPQGPAGPKGDAGAKGDRGAEGEVFLADYFGVFAANGTVVSNDGALTGGSSGEAGRYLIGLVPNDPNPFIFNTCGVSVSPRSSTVTASVEPNRIGFANVLGSTIEVWIIDSDTGDLTASAFSVAVFCP